MSERQADVCTGWLVECPDCLSFFYPLDCEPGDSRNELMTCVHGSCRTYRVRVTVDVETGEARATTELHDEPYVPGGQSTLARLIDNSPAFRNAMLDWILHK